MQDNFSENFEFQSQQWQLKNSNESKQIPNVHIQCEKYVIKNSKKGDPLDVLKVFDEFCHKNWMMNVGPVKGQIMRRAISKAKAKTILQVGGYCGYSALMMAIAAPLAQVYTIELREEYANIARKIHNHAGLKNIHIEIGVVKQCQQFIKKTGPYDFILMDHHKAYYLSDFKLLEAYGGVKKGTIVAGDNIIYPGCPDYLQYFKEEAINRYKSVLYHSYLEYSQTMTDAVLISEAL